MIANLKYDVIVIGGGPAGSSAAYFLASAGFRVALMDRAAFPRDKACGDMLSRSAIRQLERMGMLDLLAEYSPSAEWPALFRAPRGRAVRRAVKTVGQDRQHWCVIPRLDLDAALFEKAKNAGAVAYERASVEALEVHNGWINARRVGSPSGLSGRVAVIATGSVGKFAIAKPTNTLFATRAYYAGDGSNTLALDWDIHLTPGYSWQFPVLRDRYNIGVTLTHQHPPKVQADRFLHTASFAAGRTRLSPVKGGILNTGFGRAPVHSDHVLRLGDAAGLIQPHLGEGIGPALISGEIAAQCVALAFQNGSFDANALAVYSHRLHAVFDKTLALSRGLFRLMHYPRLFDALAYLVSVSHSGIFNLVATSPADVQRTHFPRYKSKPEI